MTVKILKTILILSILSLLTACSSKTKIVYKDVLIPTMCDMVEPHCLIDNESYTTKLQTIIICLKDYKTALRYCKGTLDSKPKKQELTKDKK